MYILHSNAGILRICGDEDDRPSAKQKERAKLLLMKLCLEKSPRIRDEIILQLIKQIRGNPNKISSEAAWGTLSCVTSLANPSEGFVYPVMHWLIDIIELHDSPSYKEWAKFILARIYNNLKAKDKRVFVPEINEMSYVANKKQIKVSVFMPNGAFMTCYIESYTDFDTLKKHVLQRLSFHGEPAWRFGIMEVIEYENKYGSTSVSQRRDSLKGT